MAFAGDKKVGKWLLAGYEDRLKKWLLPKVPKGIETYHLTLSTVLWCFFILLCSFLARYDIRWMWVTSLMIALQYITDLLDGAIGRERDTGLVKWGYYMDHFLDYMFLCSILIGYSFLVRDYNKYMLFFVLALFGAFMVNSFLSFAATNEFKISYLGVGPTEIRILFIVVNTMLILSNNYARAETALPFVLGLSAFGLFVTVYRTQKEMWAIDMKAKYGKGGDPAKDRIDLAVGISGWCLTRNIVFSLGIAGGAFSVLMLRAGAPYHRPIALALYVLSWVPLVLAFRNRYQILRLRGRQVRRRIRPYVLHIVVGIVLLLGARAGYVLAPVTDDYLSSASAKDLAEEFETDTGNYRVLAANMDSLLRWIESDSRRDISKMTPAERDTMRNMWGDFVATFRELEMLRERYRGFYQIDYLADPGSHAKAFALAYGSFVNQYHSALRLTVGESRVTYLATFLDEADPEAEIPANSYTGMKERLTHPDELLRLNAGRVYLSLVDRHLEDNPALVAAIEQDVETIYHMLGKRPQLFVDNPLAVFEKRAFHAWFPLQKNVARQMSLTRMTKRQNFITPGMIAAYRDQLRPGDIIMERRNWFMSNIGIPGFWPHVALYVGTAQELDRAFGKLPELNGVSPSSLLQNEFPEAYDAYARPDENGFARCIIEALRPGAVFTSLEVSGSADYLAVLRTRKSESERFAAIRSAFSHHAKPYDYNFDFATDNALVCSELVLKSYQKAGGIRLEPEIVNGRPVIAPNLIAKKFDDEFGTDGQELDLVFFLEGSEADGTATERGEDEFRRSWKRPKWDVAQK